ncbi:MAG: hypothetical protein JWO48_3538 [Bryobacterales bacterium]|nr:hypothetical protein [Bryobacterales bacterium]
MHFRVALVFALSAFGLCAQTPQDADLARAQAALAHNRELVEAGVAPRAQLRSAQQKLSEAEDDAFLRRTLYGQDVSERDADQMVAVTARRVEQRQQDVAKERQLVDEGVAPRLNLTPLIEKLDWARKEHDYAVTRAKLIHEMAEMTRDEAAYQARLESSPAEAHGLAERFDGNGSFTSHDFQKVNRAFQREFAKALPISAYGETALHRALGFDHRGRVDIAISPDQPEGVWLRQYLARNHIPYFAFRGAVPGRATGPHIHIGPMSTHVAQRG